jgi:IS5 family transposase
MARMLIIGYCYGIRSERRLCEEVGMNLVYRWFCRLGLKDKVPDHSSFSKNRHGRFRDHDAFRQLFDSVLRRCMAEGLVQGEGFATDASMINVLVRAKPVSIGAIQRRQAGRYESIWQPWNKPIRYRHCQKESPSPIQLQPGLPQQGPPFSPTQRTT